MKKFVTAINCMDGRTQIPVNEYLRAKYDAEFVDTITEPGPIKHLEAKENSDLFKSFKTRLDISVFNHGSDVVAIVAHYDCAGNPVSKDEQLVQLKTACDFVQELYPEVEVLGLWVNEDWEVEEVR